LKKDSDGYADTVASLRKKLYLPQVGPTTGRLEEWMSPDNLGETTHRHLSLLFGLYPGEPGKSVTLKGFAR
jgi:alpha-L-fucosidase 2